MITIVSHDAGGAEIISDWVLKQKKNFNYILKGPAIKIFKRKIKNIKISKSLKFIKKSKEIITGSSWGDLIEIKAIKLAKNIKLKR